MAEGDGGGNNYGELERPGAGKKCKTRRREYEAQSRKLAKCMSWFNDNGYPAAAVVTHIGLRGCVGFGSDVFKNFLTENLTGNEQWINAIGVNGAASSVTFVDYTAPISASQPGSETQAEINVQQVPRPVLGRTQTSCLKKEEKRTRLRQNCSSFVARSQGLLS
ncbi:hypothetical protein BaRGS_00036052, partial [Batillaria attramentaria]